MLRMSLLTMLVGCVVQEPDRLPPPTMPGVLPNVASVTDDALETYEDGVNSWAPIGFSSIKVEDIPPTQRACGRNWYTATPTQVDCHIPVRIERVPNLVSEHGALGYAIRSERVVVIDSSLHGLSLRGVVAHEIGHIILDTEMHSADGIMGTADWLMAPGDYELACQSIGVCLEP